MNNKAFTVVELLSSFVLTMVIMTFLFEIVIIIKSVYLDSSLKSEVLSNNSLVATTLNTHFTDKTILETNCEAVSSCLVTYTDGTSETILISGSNSVTIGDDNIVLADDVTIGSVAMSTVGPLGTNLDYYIKINYVVSGDNLDDDIVFNYVFTY